MDGIFLNNMNDLVNSTETDISLNNKFYFKRYRLCWNFAHAMTVGFPFSVLNFRRFQWLKRHDDVIKWKLSPRYWPFLRGFHQSLVGSPHKGQQRGALMFSFICAWINGWINHREAGDLRRHSAHYNVIIMDAMDDQGFAMVICKFETDCLYCYWTLVEVIQRLGISVNVICPMIWNFACIWSFCLSCFVFWNM